MNTQEVLEYARQDPLLTGSARDMVVATLEESAKVAREDGFAVINQSELAERWGISREAVRYRIKATMNRGYMRDTGERTDHKNVYELTLPDRDQTKPVLMPPPAEQSLGSLTDAVVADLLRRLTMMESRIEAMETEVRSMKEAK